jgi:hypothetical protein
MSRRQVSNSTSSLPAAGDKEVFRVARAECRVRVGGGIAIEGGLGELFLCAGR